MTKKYRESLRCCCCGGDAGQFEQHWNRDSGYGICPGCVAEEMATMNAEQIQINYGAAGVNFDRPIYREGNRMFAILAITRDPGIAAEFIARNANAVLRGISPDGYHVLVDKADEGTLIQGGSE